MTDILTRKEDIKEEQEPRKIFLQMMNIKKTKKQDYHSSMKISEIKKTDKER